MFYQLHSQHQHKELQETGAASRKGHVAQIRAGFVFPVQETSLSSFSSCKNLTQKYLPEDQPSDFGGPGSSPDKDLLRGQESEETFTSKLQFTRKHLFAISTLDFFPPLANV